MSEDKLKALLSRARLERPPSIDVARQVMAAVAARRHVPGIHEAPLAWVALAAILVAIPAGIAAVSIWTLLTDPLLGLAGSLPWWAL